MEPLFLKPCLKNYIWGGGRLCLEFGKTTDAYPVAEAWECSTNRDGSCTVIGGEYNNQRLSDVISNHPELMGTKYSNNRELPILVKLIDAQEDLSIQVHPDDAYAREYENQPGKTEMWYVIDATEDAKVICGFAHNVTEQQLTRDIVTGQVAKHFNTIPTHRGDVFYITPGTVHAIGRGNLIIEIQDNSNLTYRLWDYDRVDSNGSKRELHYKKALDVLDMSNVEATRQKNRFISYKPGYAIEHLCKNNKFHVEKVTISDKYLLLSNETSFQVVTCISGSGHIKSSDRIYDVKKGQTIFFPASMDEFVISGAMELVKVSC